MPIWDDGHYVFQQPFLQRCENIFQVLNPRYLVWVLPVENAARPVWLASVLADRCLFHGAPAGYRLTSILWHGVGAAVLFGLVLELTRNRRAAFLAGILFVVHPVHTEAVNITAFRGDLLAFAGAGLSLWLYVLSRAETKARRVLFFVSSLACFALALLAKEMAASLPLLIWLTDALFPEKLSVQSVRDRRRRWARYGLYFAVLAAYLVFRTPRAGYVMSDHMDLFSRLRENTAWLRAPVAPEARVPPDWDNSYPDFMSWRSVYHRPKIRFLTMSKIWGSYLSLLAFPVTLQGDYAPRPARSWSDAGAWISWAGWSLLLWVAWRLRRKEPAVSFGLFWIPLALLPASGLVALLNLKAERYLYVPSAGYCIAAACALARGLEAPRPGWARAAAWSLCAGLGGYFAARTVIRNRDYKDDWTFFNATNAADASIPRVHFNLAAERLYRGEVPEAEAEYRAAIRLWPGFLRARLSLAQFLMVQKRWPEAVADLLQAEQNAPNDPEVRLLLGNAYYRMGRWDESLSEFESASRLSPGLWKADMAVGILRLKRGEARPALEALRLAASETHWQSPEGMYYLAAAYRALGDASRARRAYAALSRQSAGLATAYAQGRAPDGDSDGVLWP